jgi:DNA-binding NtrC family response regulator
VPVLLALFGPKRGVRLDVETQAILGRSSEADLQLVDGKVSRQHCRFELSDGVLRVEDLGSQNGTYVNGERVPASGPRRLKAGDEIAVGDSLFVVDGDGDVATARFGDETLVVAGGAPPADGAAAVAASGDGPVDAVAALGAALRRCPDLETAARATLAAIERALSPKRAFVLLWDPVQGLARPLVGKSDGAAVSVSRTVLELCARRRRAVALQDAVEDRDLGRAKSVLRHALRAVVVAPILAPGAGGEEQVAGFLHADRPAPAFGAADAAVLECFASMLSLHGAFAPRPATAARPRAANGAGPDARRLEAAEGGAPVAESPSLRAALRTAEAVASTLSTVLITGESGTGKEEIARYIHRRGPRASGPFVAVNCGAIPEGIAESELFGHERGAFTGATTARPGEIEAADGGTLFLDEVGELPAAIQVKLLRVLQERAFCRVGSTVLRRVDVRVVAATHRDLDAAVKERRFREDLYYRLAVLRIHVDPLRDRPEDLPPLVQALLGRLSARLGRRPTEIDPRALTLLARWPWPGNVRELGNVLERALVLRAPDATSPLGPEEIAMALGDMPEPALPAGASLADKLSAVERVEIEGALRRARGVKSRAAQALGLSRPTLDKKIAELGIDLWREPARH